MHNLLSFIFGWCAVTSIVVASIAVERWIHWSRVSSLRKTRHFADLATIKLQLDMITSLAREVTVLEHELAVTNKCADSMTQSYLNTRRDLRKAQERLASLESSRAKSVSNLRNQPKLAEAA